MDLSFKLPNTKILMVSGLVVAIMILLFVLYQSGTLQGFQDLSPSSPIPSFTLYHMKGCPHCTDVLPDFNRMKASGVMLEDGRTVKINEYEQETPQGQAGVVENSIKGFPTFILKKINGENIPYEGERTVTGYKDFLMKNAYS
jgi:hypothetical protein